MKELKLKIAGIGISIRWEGSQIMDRLHQFYQDFVFDGKADINLRVHCCGHFPEYSQSKVIFDVERQGYWKLYQENSRYIIEIYETKSRKKNKVCFIEPDFSGGDVYIKPELEKVCWPRRNRPRGAFWSLPWLMKPLAEILLVNLLAKKNGIMVHGLGINDRGTGIAFLGVSGTGKSTLAGFYKSENGANILSDEQIVIRKEKGVFRLYGTPWPGMAEVTSSESVPLKRVFFIRHTPANKILGRGTFSDLLPMLFFPFWDRERIKLILKFCEELPANIECKKLGFVKNRSVIDFVRGGEEI